MRYTRIFNDDHGSARMEEGELSFAAAMFAPPAPPADVSAVMPASGVFVLKVPGGWSDAAHPAPARQWMFVLSGRGQSAAGGKTVGWGPGDALLVEDTEPPGHGTTCFEDAVLVVVRC